MTFSDVYLDKQPRHGELAALDRCCFNRPWSEADYSHLRKNPMVSAWVLRRCVASTEEQAAAHAFVCFQLVAGELEIFRIGTQPRHRQKGQGSHLLRRLIEHARKQGMHYAYLEVQAGNVPARRFYESIGFRQTGTRQAYFINPPEDALIFGLNAAQLPPLAPSP